MKLIKKTLRYIRYYGLIRVLFKAYGRAPNKYLLFVLRSYVFLKTTILRKDKQGTTLLIGCGQYAFSTIGYFLTKSGRKIHYVYDANPQQSTQFVDIFGSTIVEDPLSGDFDRVYVASNHATHTTYAKYWLSKGIWTHIEKPLSVTQSDLEHLRKFESKFLGSVGYNRPHSLFTSEVCRALMPGQPLFLNFQISGHHLGPEHWYNSPSEGTRLSGNFSHWLDLTLFFFDVIEDRSPLSVEFFLHDKTVIDDNITVHIRTENGSKSMICFQTMLEPVLGIQESHYYQQGSTIFHLKDYRSLEIVAEDNTFRKRGWKDVGHKDMFIKPSEDSSHFLRALEVTQLTLNIITALQAGISTIKFKRSRHETIGATVE